LATEHRPTPGRSPEARALAEAALARLAATLGERSNELVVIGGLVPAHLAANADNEHLGTTDVDVVLPLALSFDRDDEGQRFSWLEAALVDGGFSPETAGTGGGGWRWWGDVDGLPIKIEFLCDVGTDPRNLPVPLPGCHRLSAMNLEGPRAALEDSMLREVTDGAGTRVTLRHAGLGGYLLAKAAAAARRGLPRDFYDFAYVLLHNDRGGPREAAEAVSAGRLASLLTSYRHDLVVTLRGYTTADRPAAHHYAETMRSSASSDPALPYERHVEDATAAALEFGQTLESEL
jgi:hypothetical protein